MLGVIVVIVWCPATCSAHTFVTKLGGVAGCAYNGEFGRGEEGAHCCLRSHGGHVLSDTDLPLHNTPDGSRTKLQRL